MAISPPSDIVLDVARAVEPAQAAAARATLASRSGGVAGTSAGFSMSAAARPAGPQAPEEFKRFEAMVLQSFVQTMLPKDGTAVYGGGMAGEMWKSMLAQHVSEAMAERGGIGIADRVLGDRYRTGETATPVGPVSGGPGSAAQDRQALLSTALVEEMQRRLTRSIGEDIAAATGDTPKL